MAIDGWFPIQTFIFLMVISPIVASCPGIDDYFIKGPMLGQGGFGTVCQVRIFHGIFLDFPLNPVVGQRSLLEFPKNVVFFAQLSTRCIRTMWLGEDSKIFPGMVFQIFGRRRGHPHEAGHQSTARSQRGEGIRPETREVALARCRDWNDLEESLDTELGDIRGVGTNKHISIRVLRLGVFKIGTA